MDSNIKVLPLISLSLASITLLGVTVKPVQKIQWTPNQLAATQRACVTSALEANPKATNAQATYFCKCALAETATKWSYSDFARNEEQYTQQLGNEGVIARCARATFQLTPESKPKVEPGIAKLNPGIAQVNKQNNLSNLMEPLGKTWLNRPGGIVNLGRRN
jgi:hypothetical protein